MSTTKNLTITDFKCVICQEIIAFNTEDPSTYQSSVVIEEFFSMKLTRYVVSHFFNSEEHVNVVIADQDGRYRGHKDGYINQTSSKPVNKEFLSLTDQLLNHNAIELFTVIDLTQLTLREYINTIRIKSTAFAEKIDTFIKETREIYEILPQELTFTYAHKNFHLIHVEKDIFCCYSFINDNSKDNQKFLETFRELKPLINGSHSNSPLLKLIYTTLKITNSKSFTLKDLDYNHKLLNSEVFFSELIINPNFKDRIQEVQKTFIEEFPCSEFVISPIIKEKTTLIDIFDSNTEQYKCIIDFIEFLQRRKLFLF